jgi:hypothetical protein
MGGRSIRSIQCIGGVKPASAETQLNPSIDPGGASRERVEVLLQLLGVGAGRVGVTPLSGVTTPVLQTGKNPGIAARLPELPGKFIWLSDEGAERRETFGCVRSTRWARILRQRRA